MKSIFKKYGLEEHNESTVETEDVDNTWLSQPDTPDHSEIDELEHISETSEEVIEQIESNPEIGLEHYQWVMANALKGVAIPVPKRLGLENYVDSSRPKREYIKNLKSFKVNVDKSIALGLEAYDDSIDKTFKELLVINKKQNTKLKKLISSKPEGTAVEDNPKVLRMFARAGRAVVDMKVLLDEPKRIKEVLGQIDKMVTAIDGGKANEDSKGFFKKIFSSDGIHSRLLFNRDIVVSDNGLGVGQVDINEENKSFQQMSAEAVATFLMTMGIVVPAAVFANPLVVMSLGFIVGAGVIKVISALTHEYKEKKRQGNNRAFIDFANSIASMTSLVEDMIAINERIKGLNEDELKVVRMPTIQKAMIELTKHINELQYATIELLESYTLDETTE